MKITQQPQFNPITIVIDSPAEAVCFAQIIDAAEMTLPAGSQARSLAIELSNWFTSNVQMGCSK